MDIFKQESRYDELYQGRTGLYPGMKGPTRPAPAVPGFTVNRYSPVTNWNDDPFGDVFEPQPQYMQKKKPPPRPPPPKINRQPDIPAKPSHFIRRPTVLSSLLSRKNKSSVTTQQVSSQNINTDFVSSELDTSRMFPRCEPKNVHTGALIDLSSPPSSPTFTTRSSSDGLSVDSFGSDATTSTNQHNVNNGGNQSQAESGFEDDFELFLHSRKSGDDTFDDITAVDPFSPQVTSTKPSIAKKPVISKDFVDISSQQSVLSSRGPTIIRAKPARPKPPDNIAILKSTFGSSLPVATMNVNTTTPIQKINSNFGDSFANPLRWDDDGDSSPERESSPPMPSIPPPPPPPDVEQLSAEWPDESEMPVTWNADQYDEEPHAIALYDYFTDHPDDLNFSANTRIKLLRRVDNDWLFGRLRSGAEGLFPANYVQIKVPLAEDSTRLGTAIALYQFDPVEAGDLRFRAGDTIKLLYKINEEWCFGECNGLKGQFPVNYVQIS